MSIRKDEITNEDTKKMLKGARNPINNKYLIFISREDCALIQEALAAIIDYRGEFIETYRRFQKQIELNEKSAKNQD